MKRFYSDCISMIHTNFKKGFLFLFMVLAITLSSSAVSKTITSGSWSTGANWSPAGVPTAADDVIIDGNITVTSTTINALTITVNASRVFTLQNSTVANISGALTNNGTLVIDPNGQNLIVNLGGVNAHWINNGTLTVNNNYTVNMNGPGSYIGGSSVSTFHNLTINPGVSNIVALSNPSMIIRDGGTLTLQSGIFKVGATNVITANKVLTIDNTGGGNFASSIDGLGNTDLDAGTFNIAGSSGANITLNSSVANKMQIGSLITTSDGNWRLNIPTANSVRINGTLKVNGGQSNSWALTGNSPIYGPISTFYMDHNNMAYSQGLEWAAASGTIGVTPGYPNNVTITNVGNSVSAGYGWVAGSAALAINGTLTIGDGVTTGQVNFAAISALNVKNFVLGVGSRFAPPDATMTVTGDWTDNQGVKSGTTGFWPSSTSTVNFSGGGTSTIEVTGASTNTETFNNLTVTNGTYVKLNDPVSVATTGKLTLTSGYVGTTATNLLTVLNTSNGAVVGGSPTAYVDGPLKWAMPLDPGAIDYVYPIGDKTNNGGAYLPLTFTPNATTPATQLTATAFNLNSGGTFTTPITSISTTEYWSLNATVAPSNGSKVDVERPSPTSPFTSLAKSSAAAGNYTSIGGTPAALGGTRINDGLPGTTNPAFIVMAVTIPVPLGVERVGGSTGLDINCNPTTGTLVVGGFGGTGPYEYSLTGAVGTWQTTPTFLGLSVGTQIIYVKDAVPNVASATLKVLGPLQINGNNEDITLCNPQPVTLTATNDQNTSATYSWTPGGQTTASITVTPVATTTYTVSSTVPFNGANLISNGGFESGTPTGFNTASGYTLYSGAAYPTTPTSPTNGAYYQFNSAATNMCTNFANPGSGAHGGSKYFIGDGGVVAGEIFRLAITGLTASTTYTFSYWYMRGSVSAPFTPIETSVLSGPVLGTVVASNTAWAQASYTVTSDGSGNATIILKNTSPTTSTNGNDFLIDDLELRLLKTCPVTATMRIVIDCAALPVDLISFNAVKQGDGALVSWTTASEKNSAYYIVQKSTDGVNFYPVGRVEAKGNNSATQNYSLVDPTIAEGLTYYRLEEHDIDGAIQYSEIKTVSKDGLSGVQVTPNPNNGVFVVTFDNSGDDKTRVTVLNSLGQIVYTSPETETNFKNVDISTLASGVYYLQVNTLDEKVVKKIIKE